MQPTLFNSSFVQGYFLFFFFFKKKLWCLAWDREQGEVIASSQDFEVEISHVIAIVAVDESTDPDFKQQPLGRPWRSNGWDSALLLQGAQLQSLVRELRPQVPHGMANKIIIK